MIITERIVFCFMSVFASETRWHMKAVRDTRDALTASGFAVEIKEIPNHTHDYYSRAAEINLKA